MWSISPMMMASAVDPVTFIAAGSQTSTTLTLADKGAAVDDILWLFSPQNQGIPASPGFVPSGSGWTSTSYVVTLGAVATFVWKKITSTDAISLTVTGPNYGFSYGIYRGPQTCAVVVDDTDSAGADTDHAITWPAKNAACVALVALGRQASAACNMSADTGWTDRNHGFANTGGSPMAYDVLDSFTPPAGSHVTTFPGVFADGGTAPHRIIGVELRT